jgi:hypothetical protein
MYNGTNILKDGSYYHPGNRLTKISLSVCRADFFSFAEFDCFLYTYVLPLEPCFAHRPSACPSSARYKPKANTKLFSLCRWESFTHITGDAYASYVPDPTPSMFGYPYESPLISLTCNSYTYFETDHWNITIAQHLRLLASSIPLRATPGATWDLQF